jgi:hypothetical protein
MKDGFYEELERLCDKFPKNHMKVLGDFSVKVWRENIFNPKTGYESLHEITKR